jgi:hypothetical protein
MNERIKQLAEQAGLTWRVQPLHYTNTNNPIDFPVSANRDLEKFAELIVRECVDICQQATEQNNQTYAMLKEDELAEKMVIHGSIKQAEKLAQGIKHHFGVEE